MHSRTFFALFTLLAMCLLNFWLDYITTPRYFVLIHIVRRVFTYLVGRWQTSSAVEGYHFTFGGIEGHLVCARPFRQRVNVGLEELSVRGVVDNTRQQKYYRHRN